MPFLLKVIPVIDVLNEIVVHAVKGQRKEYKPLKSILVESVNPVEVAETFKNLGFNQMYLADLDSIITCSSNFEMFRAINDRSGLKLMVDAGVTSLERAKLLIEKGVSKVIIGTETLQRQRFVQEAVEVLGYDNVVVSLDLRGKIPVVKPGFDGFTDPVCLLKTFKDMGLKEAIILELTRVGSGEGVDFDFVKKVKDETGINIYIGGGVRDIRDLVELNRLGFAGALVATALHNGRITIDQLKQEGLL